ncbi:MAG: ribosome maturation factor RimM [Sandaracinaceae bacterium]|nr:ribosome maturation factor RimM [Sandaracinaceae bacterium]
MTSWIRMGVVHAYGLRGELKAVLDNESSTLRWVGLSVRLASKDGATERALRVASFRRTGGLGFLRLEGVDDRNAAEALEGHTLSVSRDDLPPLGDDEVYLADLVGLPVEHRGERIGTVTRIEIYPSSSAAVVRTNDREIEVPLHPPYVEEVDLRERVVRVAHLEDLVDPGGR